MSPALTHRRTARLKAATHHATAIAQMQFTLWPAAAKGADKTPFQARSVLSRAWDDISTASHRRRHDHRATSDASQLKRSFADNAEALLQGIPKATQLAADEPCFYSHDVLRDLVQTGRRRERLEHLLETLVEAMPSRKHCSKSLVQKVIGANAGSSLIRFFLAALMLQERPPDPYDEMWRTFLDHTAKGTLTDSMFTEHNVKARVDFFGSKYGRSSASYHQVFWPLQLVEGTITDQKLRVLPLISRSTMGASDRHWKVALSGGAIESSSSHAHDHNALFVKIVDTPSTCPDPPNEWTLAQTLHSNPTQSKHINAPFAGIKDDDGRYHLFSDWSGVSLADFLRSHEPRDFALRPEAFLPQLFQDLAAAVAHCHAGLTDVVLVHGDLHEENVMVLQPDADHPGHLRFAIVDFGNGHLLDKHTLKPRSPPPSSVHNFGPGTAPEMRAEEMLVSKMTTPSSDIWSLGRVVALALVWAACGSRLFDQLLEALGGDAFWIEREGQFELHYFVTAYMQKAKHRMAGNANERRRFSMLCDLTLNGMLCIDPQGRKDISQIRQRLHEIFLPGR